MFCVNGLAAVVVGLALPGVMTTSSASGLAFDLDVSTRQAEPIVIINLEQEAIQEPYETPPIEGI